MHLVVILTVLHHGMGFSVVLLGRGSASNAAFSPCVAACVHLSFDWDFRMGLTFGWLLLILLKQFSRVSGSLAFIWSLGLYLFEVTRGTIY